MKLAPEPMYHSAPFESLLDERLRHQHFAHQATEFDARSHLDSCALVWRPRTGKSKAVIDAAFRAAERGELDALLITAPNGVHKNWLRRELPEHAWSAVPWRGLAWDTALGARTRPLERYRSRSARQEAEDWQAAFDALLKSDDFQVLTVNHESMHLAQVEDQLHRFVRRRGLRLGVVFDEAHAFRRAGSKWTTMARRLAKSARWRRLLSATPWTERPLQAYSEYGLLSVQAGEGVGGSLGFDTKEDFERAYVTWEEALNRRTGRSYKRVKEYHDLEDLGTRVAAWSSFVRTEDVFDVPPVAWRELTTSMSDAQASAYAQLRDEYRLETPEVLHDFVEGGARLTRLQQVLSGFVRDAAGKTVWLDRDAPRYLDTIEEILTADGPVIVWCAFREETRRLAELLREAGGTALTYDGDSTERERAEARDLLHPSCDAVLPHPLALFATSSSGAGSGLNLSRASKFVWFGHTKEAIVREQASERCSAIGGGIVEGVDVRCPDTVDDFILYDLLPTKFDLEGTVTRSALDFRKAFELGETWVHKTR